jgi:hypothetical protein
MLRRAALVLGALLVLNTTGCVLFNLLALPVQLLLSVCGLVGDGVSALAGAVAEVEPLSGPEPRVAEVAPGQFRISGIEPTTRFRVTCSAPGRVTSVVTWPDDLAARADVCPDEAAAGAVTLRVACRLEPLSASGRPQGSVRR